MSKELTYTLQYISGFSLLATLYFLEGWMQVLFALEAFGQIILAYANQNNVNDPKIRYFPDGTYGKLAATIFTNTIFARFSIASQYLNLSELEYGDIVRLLVVIICSMIIKRKIWIVDRIDSKFVGVAMWLGTIFLAGCSYYGGDMIMAGFQMLYALSLIPLSIALPPHVLEAQNVVSWLLLAYLYEG
eukprot:TRINITY_DN2174_c0_g1_i2.p1 TRINITY_DN2174_c0_g1~~TRINITY_DN2174_c0_g1_i2.p1  ORF type:complete len:188 (-),score=33.05 TRINITY_DN2174_c0_g1_i2:33-596(-)